MKALLDTNIVIHREANRVLNRDIGNLFKWLDKGGYEKWVHPVTIAELAKNGNAATADLFGVKLDSYQQMTQIAPINSVVMGVSQREDTTENDRNDTVLLNEVYCGRVDILISEDKKIHRKAGLLGIAERIFRIDAFLEKVLAEHPDLIDYKVLSVAKRRFGEINLSDRFFDSLKADYHSFEKWFNRKAEEFAYVSLFNSNLLAFLFLKVEDRSESYTDISPAFAPKKRLKVGTFKVVANGLRLGERFLKIIFDNAVANKTEEIYVTIFDRTDEQRRLINLLMDWGFVKYGVKRGESGEEFVYTRDMRPIFNPESPKLTFPYFPRTRRTFLVPIYPDYHTELLPDSILRTENPVDFIDHAPHRNAISKVYISRSVERNLHRGDVIVFYRTKAPNGNAYHTSVVSTVGIVEDVIKSIPDEAAFVSVCRKRSVFSDTELLRHWNYNPRSRPFVVNFLCVYSFPKRVNLEWLIANRVIADIESVPRGFTQITQEQFETVLKGTQTDESLVVD
jgi:predicted nucleic acid-binding protein